VSFGGEDDGDLTGTFLRAIFGTGLLAPADVTIVEGPLFGDRSWHEGIRVVRGVRDLATLFPRSDLLVTHFGMSALEALAAGLPAVTTTMNGAGELMRDGREGLIIAPGSAPALDGALRALFDADRRKSMGIAARALAENHTLDHNVRRMTAVYEEVIALKGRA